MNIESELQKIENNSSKIFDGIRFFKDGKEVKIIYESFFKEAIQNSFLFGSMCQQITTLKLMLDSAFKDCMSKENRYTLINELKQMLDYLEDKTNKQELTSGGWEYTRRD